MSRDSLMGFPILLPPLEEQRAIADFLDRETAKIDTLIAKQEQLITTLGERRRSAITTLLEREPSERKIKLKWIFQFMNGDRGSNYPTSEEIIEEGIPFINAGDLVGDGLSLDNMKYVSELKYQTMGGAKLLDGDILYCLRGSVGKTAVFRGDIGGSLASSLVALRNMDEAATDTTFMYLLLNSPQEVAQRNYLMSGSAQPNLGAEALGSMVFWVPTIDKQRDAVLRASALTIGIDETIEASRKLVRTLLERRQALISAATTGKIDLTKGA
jgi:type I restriction enzyme S subunit